LDAPVTTAILPLSLWTLVDTIFLVGSVDLSQQSDFERFDQERAAWSGRWSSPEPWMTHLSQTKSSPLCVPALKRVEIPVSLQARNEASDAVWTSDQFWI